MKTKYISTFFFAITFLTTVVSFANATTHKDEEANLQIKKLLEVPWNQSPRSIPNDSRRPLDRKESPEELTLGFLNLRHSSISPFSNFI